MGAEVMKFVDELKADSTFFSNVLAANSLAEVVAMANTRGFIFTVEDFEREANGQGLLQSSDLISAFGSDLEEISSGPATCPCTWQD